MVTETDEGGHITKHQYDLAGRQISVTQAYATSNAPTTTFTYDAAGRKLTETDPLDHTTTNAYDNAGNQIAVAGPTGNFQYAYDNARNRISVTDRNGNASSYQYDSRKHLTKSIYPDGTSKTYAYDGSGNLISVTDQASNVVQYNYDVANELQSVVQLNSPNTSVNTTSYSYDPLGDLAALTDADGHTTQNAFDLLSEPVSRVLPRSQTETRQYDAAGNLIALTHFNGKTTTYTHDDLNRLQTRTPDSSTGESAVSFTYTPTGKRASMTDASGTTTYGYDTMDRLRSKSTPEGTLSYTYDAGGTLASMTSSNANGVSTSYTYDSLNRLSTVVDNRLPGANITTYSYDSANNVTTASCPNGVQMVFQYDTLNRMTALASPSTGYLYQLGPTGNRTSATEYNGRTLNWSFDGIFRLTNETISDAPSGKNGSVSYGLDPVGNRLSANSSLSGVTSGNFNYNSDDELSNETYDSNGNTLATGGKAFTYDSENRLVSMNGSTVAVVYDGDGNRVAKTVDGVTTRYLVDDLNQTGYVLRGKDVISRLSQLNWCLLQPSKSPRGMIRSRPQLAIGCRV